VKKAAVIALIALVVVGIGGIRDNAVFEMVSFGIRGCGAASLMA